MQWLRVVAGAAEFISQLLPVCSAQRAVLYSARRPQRSSLRCRRRDVGNILPPARVHITSTVSTLLECFKC